MNVKELINRLNKLDKKLEVILSIDPEGSGFSTVSDLSIGYTEIQPRCKTDEFYSEEEAEGTDCGDMEKCVCIWPTH